MKRRLFFWTSILFLFWSVFAPFVWAQESPFNGELLLGPMLGGGDKQTVWVWIQTTHKAEVYYAVRSANGARSFKTPTQLTPEPNFILKTPISGLESGREYEYTLYVNGKKAAGPYRFYPPSNVAEPTLKFAVGSCALLWGRAFDEKKNLQRKPPAGRARIYSSITAHKPDVMLWMGDNVYLIGDEAYDEKKMRARYVYNRSLPRLRPLLATARNYATWDDHDMGGNDCERTFSGKNITRRVFMDYWVNPSYGIEADSAITTYFREGDVEVYLLDGRWYRDPKNTPPESATLLGQKQYQWLTQSLEKSDARLKMIAIGTQVLNVSNDHETYFHHFYPERERLLQHIIQKKIDGVFFLTGDMHYTDLTRLEPPNFYPLYDLTISPLISPDVNLRLYYHNHKRMRVPGFFYGWPNYAILKIKGAGPHRRLDIGVYSRRGKKKRSFSILFDELKAPR